MKNLFLALFAVATVASCTTITGSKVGSAQPNIIDTHWTLADDIRGKKPTLNIEAGKITGNGSCNNYFGTLSLDATAGNFRATNIGATKMACTQMDIESNFFKMLNEADKYVVNNGTLELYKGKLLLLKLVKL